MNIQRIQKPKQDSFQQNNQKYFRGRGRSSELKSVEADGGRSMERKHLRNGAQVEVEGRGGRFADWSRDAEEGSGVGQRAEWGPPPEKGRSGGHSQEEFAGASPVQSVNSLDGASAIPLSFTELCAEIAPVAPVSLREQQQLSPSRATTTFPIPGINNSPPFALRERRSPRPFPTPTVVPPVKHVPARRTPERAHRPRQARYADIAACPPSRHEGAGKTLRSRGPGRSSRFHAHLVHVCHPCL